MRTRRVVVAGLGNVGQAFLRLLAAGHTALADVGLVGAVDTRHGSIVEPDGIDPSELLTSIEANRFETMAGYRTDADVFSTIDGSEADTFVELTFTNLDSGEPATSYIKHALAKGLDVTTTNKGPVALHLPVLLELAQNRGCEFRYEGTVMSGTPILQMAPTVGLADFESLLGILNGTTNFVLSQMEFGLSYEDALKEAQARGLAEADPAGDVEGYDIAAKLVILARLITGHSLSIGDVGRAPLDQADSEEILADLERGDRWRYVGTLERRSTGLIASVGLRRFPADNPLAGLAGAQNAVLFRTGLLGEICITGPGAGPTETAHAVVGDISRFATR